MVTIDFANQEAIRFLQDKSSLADSQLKYKVSNQEIIIASKDNEYSGYLILDYLWGHIPFISFIQVLPEEQRKGIGKKILDFLENYLKSCGQYVLFSSSMENATDAQTWHKRMGFVESGLITKINGNNIGEVFFRKELK